MTSKTLNKVNDDYFGFQRLIELYDSLKNHIFDDIEIHLTNFLVPT